MKMEDKVIVFNMGDSFESFVGVIEWTRESAQHIYELMNRCRTFKSELDVIEISAFACVDVYLEASMPDEIQDALADAPDGFLILDPKDFTDEGSHRERVCSSIVKVGRGNFDYEVWLKHQDAPVLGRADFNLRNDEIRGLFQGLM
jgi:hypothetical protein